MIITSLSDINLAGEPKPHRSKTTKRQAGDMYRCATALLVLVSWFETDFVLSVSHLLLLLVSPFLYHSSSTFELDYDFQRDYYDRYNVYLLLTLTSKLLKWLPGQCLLNTLVRVLVVFFCLFCLACKHTYLAFLIHVVYLQGFLK